MIILTQSKHCYIHFPALPSIHDIVLSVFAAEVPSINAITPLLFCLIIRCLSLIDYSLFINLWVVLGVSIQRTLTSWPDLHRFLSMWHRGMLPPHGSRWKIAETTTGILSPIGWFSLDWAAFLWDDFWIDDRVGCDPFHCDYKFLIKLIWRWSIKPSFLLNSRFEFFGLMSSFESLLPVSWSNKR